jgi:Lrp/AsnC family transcriptional regulator, leucine-responsive regulatory protein
MAQIELDSIDYQILELLGRNARIPNTELADEVGLTPAPCLRRVKRLEELGVIEGYSARVNSSSLGLGLTVFVSVTLDRQTKGSYDTFAQEITVHPEVQECYLMLGEHDFLLKIMVTHLEAYQRFYLNHLTTIPGVRNINSSIVVKEEKRLQNLVTLPSKRVP